MEFAEFILAHDADDLSRLALARARYAAEVADFDLALTTLEVRRKLRTKVPQWYANPSLRFPLRLSGEQCSSAETARYKAKVAADACGGGALADLTGGLGVDAWAFAQVFDRVLYNEMKPELAAAATANFAALGVGNIVVRNSTVGETSVSQILGDFTPDILFLDPARRATDGRKVFRLEDCQPDVLQLLPELLAASPKVLLKLSPMADITLVCRQLGCVKTVHVVAAEGECKELLLLLERGYEGPYTTVVYENGSVLALDQVRGETVFAESVEGMLFEPGKALLKSGAFDVPCAFGLKKLARHTHLYIGEEVPEALRPFGKQFRILETAPLDKRSMKDIGKRYPKASVTARNIPMTSDELRRRLGVADGGSVHVFGIHVADNILIVCQLAQQTGA
jgi:hypothetical protein